MSFKSILATLVVAAVAVFLVLWSQQPKRVETPTPVSPSETKTVAANAAAQAPKPSVPDVTAVVSEKKIEAPATTPAAIARKVETLQQLAMNSDAASLRTILAELTNSVPEIRAAAREAAIQFGDVSAATTLRQVAGQTEDLDEKVALLEAAKYLELPSFPIQSGTNPATVLPPNQ